MEMYSILKISLYTTNQHKKWNNFYFEHFPQSSKLTLGRADHIKYAGMFLETSYIDRIYDVDINNLAGYEECTLCDLANLSPYRVE